MEKETITINASIRTCDERSTGAQQLSRKIRTRKQREDARLAVKLSGFHLPANAPGFVITLTRIAPRALDGNDGLEQSLKAVQDGVADALKGIGANGHRIGWKLGQQLGCDYAVIIDIRPETNNGRHFAFKGRTAKEKR